MCMNKGDCKNEIHNWLVKLSAEKYCMVQSKEAGERFCG